MDRLFCYYGDDFTGSTDALEALAVNAVPAVLFLDAPSDEMLSRYSGCRAIGVAGESRSHDPEWMSAHLPGTFRRLLELRAGIFQYKVCSTFDSSARLGSIGRALEIGQDIFQVSWVPVVVAAPHLGRYVLFGNLFAAGGGEICRIDRHPTMRHHPVTPMLEADLRLHLGQQTSRNIEVFDVLALSGDKPENRLNKLLERQPSVIIFDGLDERTLQVTGKLLWERRPVHHSFAVGSGGLTHALAAHWRASGEIAPSHSNALPNPVDRLAVVSGSCSPVTENQIRTAIANGWFGIKIDAIGADHSATLNSALSALSYGKSVVLYSALGAGDRLPEQGGERLGRRLGLLLRDLLMRSGVRRAIVAGGDTSSHAVRQLGIEALTFVRPTTPGAPLCRCHAPGSELDGLELVLKGGQVGAEDYFERVKDSKR